MGGKEAKRVASCTVPEDSWLQGLWGQGRWSPSGMRELKYPSGTPTPVSYRVLFWGVV